MRDSLRLALSAALAVVTLLCADRAGAQDAPPSKATFALIVGANQSVDNLTPLKYADDDAARYLDLFRLLGARTYLLSRLDDNTRRLHPQAAARCLALRSGHSKQCHAGFLAPGAGGAAFQPAPGLHPPPGVQLL